MKEFYAGKTGSPSYEVSPAPNQPPPSPGTGTSAHVEAMLTTLQPFNPTSLIQDQGRQSRARQWIIHKMLIISLFRICQLELVFQLFFIKLQPPPPVPSALLYLLRHACELKMELSDLINTKVISSFIALSFVHVMYNFCMIFLLNFMYRKSSFISIFHNFLPETDRQSFS